MGSESLGDEALKHVPWPWTFLSCFLAIVRCSTMKSCLTTVHSEAMESADHRLNLKPQHSSVELFLLGVV